MKLPCNSILRHGQSFKASSGFCDFVDSYNMLDFFPWVNPPHACWKQGFFQGFCNVAKVGKPSSRKWFCKIWIHTRYEGGEKGSLLVFLATLFGSYHKTGNLESGEFGPFFEWNILLYRLKSYFSCQNLAKNLPTKETLLGTMVKIPKLFLNITNITCTKVFSFQFRDVIKVAIIHKMI